MGTSRRRFLTATFGIAIGAAIGRRDALAYEKCQRRDRSSCEVGLRTPSMDLSRQSLSQWCWAASLSNVFKWYRRSVSQETIVRTLYGGLANLPAFSGAQMSALMSRRWRDQKTHAEFDCNIRGLYDVRAGFTHLDHAEIVRALRDQKPLLIANQSHAMVLTAAAYSGPESNITSLDFFDPWPGRGLRGPDRPGELRAAHVGGELTYVALPEIERRS
jgi:Papain-like cysteine protease AvrRpt2